MDEKAEYPNTHWEIYRNRLQEICNEAGIDLRSLVKGGSILCLDVGEGDEALALAQFEPLKIVCSERRTQ